jgi:hypothetical protein
VRTGTAVIGLKLRLVERADPDPASLVVLVGFAECIAGFLQRLQGSLRIARDRMDLGCDGGKPALRQGACHSGGGMAGLVDEVNGLLRFAAVAGMEAHAAERERSKFAGLSLSGRGYR